MQWLIYYQQKQFMPRRFKWLMEMPRPRDTTVLVSSIQEDKCTHDLLKKYFNEGVFGREAVHSLYFVKHTEKLNYWLSRQEKLKKELAKAQKRKSKTGQAAKAGLLGVINLDGLHGGRPLAARLSEAEQQVKTLKEQLDTSDEFNSTYAFVTFNHRREAAVALKLFSEEDEEEIVIEIAPDPADLIWEDMLVDPNAQKFRDFLGVAFILGLFISFMPVVVFISTIASLETLQKLIPAIEKMVEAWPTIASLWNGLVGSVALGFMMSMIPTFLVLIFQRFFVLKARAWTQHYLQQWYFYFLVVFVLLVTAIGTSLIQTVSALVREPMQIFVLLAAKMPQSTHFYLNFVPIQAAALAVNLTRYVNLLKYLLVKWYYNSEELGKEYCEPEDQDFYGIGSRCARSTLLLVMCLVFCTLSPMITCLGVLYFLIARVTYGYLFTYCENTKIDLGGVFWCTQLNNLQQGLYLYVALMTGVLMERAGSWIPGALSGGAFLYLYYSHRAMLREFRWESLALGELGDVDETPQKEPPRTSRAREISEPLRTSGGKQPEIKIMSYKQPELPQPIAEEPGKRTPVRGRHWSLVGLGVC